MVKENRWDRITDKLKARTDRISGRLSTINKGANPYRQEIVPTKERLMEFAQLTDEDIQMGYGIDEGAMNKYLAEMNELLRSKK